MKYALLLLLSSPLAARAGAPTDPRALNSYGFDASIPLPRVRLLPPWGNSRVRGRAQRLLEPLYR